ncbi:MAG: DUF1805 domain-containing protein [Thermoplasmataceae archaeon]
MIESREVVIEGKRLQYMRMPLFKAPVLILKGEKGYVMCGYLNIDAAEKLNDVAIRVTGVNSLDDMLNAQVKEATSGARSIGVNPGSKVSDIIHLIA